MTRYLAFVVGLWASAALADDVTLALPLACLPNVDCFVQAYPDLRAGADVANPQDYRCGNRTVAGNTGTDFIFTDRMTTADKPVLAAAPGRVVKVLNTVRDVPTKTRRRKKEAPPVDPCGNQVVLDHGGGYQTRYCHLKMGSVSVAEGQTVAVGDPLGQVGQSGATFPHLHFEVRLNGTPVDPFVSRSLANPSFCYSTRDRSLWATEVDLPYLPAGVVATGFAPRLPQLYEAETQAGNEKVVRGSPKLVAWVRGYGAQAGDHETLSIYRPDGKLFKTHERTYGLNLPWFYTSLMVTLERELAPGAWAARYTLTRGGDTLIERGFRVDVE